ncbi:RagB/SusD family nutrient uptake outer membrane protein [Robertkochia solimangrovi]|uniref:RagB/SusD family nutrient uptake outer membrane protein n=1 Tax=Robertkochia solimangrovi TaxID=2213046 RepID=UPI00117E6552|nr:RagB/SusD family nutrient uptake outer membrane protein [Robertkochia solimangrovi]TRZ41600.1 RagB/SusD family nutrient uptake outer membrane protein [Robertkochia solimangrovi]
MRKYITFIAILWSLSLVTSCSDSFLDEEVQDAYSASNVTDKLSLNAALIGLYQQISNYYTYSGEQGWLCVWQVGTDITWPTQPQGAEIPFYRYNTLTSDNGVALRIWSLDYNIIENSNNVIYAIDVNGDQISDMTEAEKLQFSAEAKFFRARAYNEMATLFGGVPLVTEPIKEPRTDFVRASLQEINALIESDLLFAISNLPAIGQTVEEQRVSSAAASQLLAKVYLRMGDYAQAEAQCDILIDNPSIALVSNRYGVKAGEEGDAFSDMFLVGNQRRSQGNSEAIWVLENENPSDVRGGSSGSPQQRRVWGGAYHNRNGMIPADSLGGRGLSRMRLNNWVLYDLYDNSDMRNSKYSIHRRFKYNNPNTPDLYGQDVPYEGPDTLFIINPYTLKWGQFDPRDVFGYGMWKDFILMRLGETYLLKAEAQFMQGDLEGAAASINALRTRANAPLVDASDIDMDFILDERVRELLGEENRRLELMRTGTLLDRVYLNDDAPENMKIEGISEKNLLFPIPITEIQLNKDAELEQNPGY